jgi:hypothetical protein
VIPLPQTGPSDGIRLVLENHEARGTIMLGGHHPYAALQAIFNEFSSVGFSHLDGITPATWIG